jgi:hypothetical protein
MTGQRTVLAENELRPLLWRRAEGIARAPSPQGLITGVDGEGGIVGVVEHVALVVADHDQRVGSIHSQLLAQDRERGLDPLDLSVDDRWRGDLLPRAARELLPGLLRDSLHDPGPVLRLLEHHRCV